MAGLSQDELLSDEELQEYLTAQPSPVMDEPVTQAPDAPEVTTTMPEEKSTLETIRESGVPETIGGGPEFTEEDLIDPFEPVAPEVPDPYEEERVIEELPTTTLQDAYTSLLDRYDIAAEDTTKILPTMRIDAEAAMVAGEDLTAAQLQLLLPDMPDVQRSRVSRRADMSLPDVVEDLRLQRYEEIDKGSGIITEQLAADAEDKIANYKSVELNATRRILIPAEKKYGKDSPEYKDALNKFNSFMSEQEANYEAKEGGTLFAKSSKEAMTFAVQDEQERVDRAFESADYFLNNRNIYLRNAARQAFIPVQEGIMSVETFNAVMMADETFDPIAAVAEVPWNWADMQEELRKGNVKGAAFEGAMAAVNLVTAIPMAKALSAGISKGWKAIGGGKGAYNDVMTAMAAENRQAYLIKKQARGVANQNPDVRNQIIKEFEEQFKVTISVADDAGNLQVDPKLVRSTGKKKISEYFSDMGYVGTDGKTVSLTDYAINDDALAIPILNPDKMDMFVATVVGLKKNPKFAEALETTGKERLVDKLFDLTLNKDLLGSEELLEELTKNGLAFEEYVLGVVGSGSDAGKILNQLSQLKRMKPQSVKDAQQTKAKIETQKAFGRLWTGTVLRTENARRGLMVSSFATTMRNLQSALIRAPMESLADVMDTSILTYQLAKQSGASTPKALLKFHNSINPLVRDGTWGGAFNNMRYIFKDQQVAEQFTNYILDRPELAEQMEKMFHNINEIQEYTGRGQAQTMIGKGADNVMSRVEDMVWTLNGPNRWQEHMIRRATFLAELERQVGLNWNIDLKTALKEGKIDEMLRDAPSVRPSGSRNFIDMVEEASQKALDVTYAKQPDFKPFKAVSDTITKSGLTVVVPFPRFMFNSMEYMAQNTGGALLVPIRKAISKESRAAGITARDRQDITRNLVGIATMSAFYQMRQNGFGSNDYTMVTDGENQVDISAQYPLRQMAWITEFYARQQEGTLDTWYGMETKEIAETFLGSTLRTGTGNVFVDEITTMIEGTEDIIDEERRSKTIGRLIGQYAATYLTPIYQLTEAQRVQGARGEEAKDFRGSISPESGLYAAEHPSVRAIYEVFAQRGLAAPSFEEELPQRVNIVRGKQQRPDSAARLYAGLTITERDSDVEDYLKEIGYGEPTFQLGSKSRVPANQIAENEFISAVLPTMVEVVQELAETMEPNDKNARNLFARKEIKNVANELRQEFNDPYLGDVSPAAVLVDELSRLSKEDRQYGIVTFKRNNDGRLPDIRSLEDLMEYAEYCKINYLK